MSDYQTCVVLLILLCGSDYTWSDSFTYLPIPKRIFCIRPWLMVLYPKEKGGVGFEEFKSLEAVELLLIIWGTWPYGGSDNCNWWCGVLGI